MMGVIAFEFPLGLLFALPFAFLLGLAIWRQGQRGLARRRVWVTNVLRAVALLALVFLAARPVWIVREPPAGAARSVALLMDSSESMALEESDKTRYQQ